MRLTVRRISSGFYIIICIKKPDWRIASSPVFVELRLTVRRISV